MANLQKHDSASLTEIGDPDQQLVFAAAENNVPEIKRLRKTFGAKINAAADASLGHGTVFFDENGVSQPESEKLSALMAALSSGAFEAALYLAKEGADGTFLYKQEGLAARKALDLLVSDQVWERPAVPLEDALTGKIPKEVEDRMNRNFQTDLFTPEQRVQIFDALVAHTKKPLDLLSDATVGLTLGFGRAELIPKLYEIGVTFKDSDFVQAAHPLFREHKAIPTMEALLPFLSGVNAAEASGQNAGHATAHKADLAAFRWLEKKGLARNDYAQGTRPSTYAHALVSTIRSDEKDMKRRVAFANYLVKRKYPIDTPGAGLKKPTPVDLALEEKYVPVALVYLDGGAEPKPEYLRKAIYQMHFGATPGDVIAIGDTLEEKGALSRDALIEAYEELFHIIGWNNKNLQNAVPVAAYLSGKGLAPPEAARLLGAKGRGGKTTAEISRRLEAAMASPALTDGKPGGKRVR